MFLSYTTLTMTADAKRQLRDVLVLHSSFPEHMLAPFGVDVYGPDPNLDVFIFKNLLLIYLVQMLVLWWWWVFRFLYLCLLLPTTQTFATTSKVLHIKCEFTFIFRGTSRKVFTLEQAVALLSNMSVCVPFNRSEKPTFSSPLFVFTEKVLQIIVNV